MHMRAFTSLAFAMPIVLAFAACQNDKMSYDTINGPENVNQAPLFSADNRQQDSTNLRLYRNAVADSAFYTKAAPPDVDSIVTSGKSDTLAGKP